MYIRFVVGSEKDDHRKLTGIITEAQSLKENGELSAYGVEYLEELFEWLNTNLPRPPFSTSNWSKDTVCWFKPTAIEPIKRMWEIANLLKEHGKNVQVLKSNMPGRSLYEDEYQLVIIERKQL
jgi:hypothetical protein